MRKRVLIAGGGTGGHIAPALAVGGAIEEAGWGRVFYARTERPVDRVMYAGKGDRVHILKSPRLDRGTSILLPLTGTAALIRAVRLLKRLDISAVLGTGGYASFFAVAASKLAGVPGAVLDTNAVPGKSNRWVSRFCRLAFAGFPGQEDLFRCPVVTVGIPRVPVPDVPGAHGRVGVSGDERVVLVLGGSQGASALNDLALRCPGEITLLLQSGDRDRPRVTELVRGRKNLRVEGFLNDLSDWYRVSLVAVARAGAQTLAELSAFGVPAVFIPYPHAAHDHQAKNAEVAVKAGGALMIRQEDLDPDRFWSMVMNLLDDRERLSAMSGAMRDLLPGDSAGRVSDEMRRLCG